MKLKLYNKVNQKSNNKVIEIWINLNLKQID